MASGLHGGTVVYISRLGSKQSANIPGSGLLYLGSCWAWFVEFPRYCCCEFLNVRNCCSLKKKLNNIISFEAENQFERLHKCFWWPQRESYNCLVCILYLTILSTLRSMKIYVLNFLPFVFWLVWKIFYLLPPKVRYYGQEEFLHVHSSWDVLLFFIALVWR